MGAWHYGPFENDSALDWLDRVERDIYNRIRGELRAAGDNHMERVAAAALLVELTEKRRQPLHLDLNYEAHIGGLFDLAITAIGEVRNDAEEIAEWKHPKLYTKSLDDLLRQLKWRRSVARRQYIRRVVDQGWKTVPANKTRKARKRFTGRKQK
jgi:Domain of unknown function (DUF4259)